MENGKRKIMWCLTILVVAAVSIGSNLLCEDKYVAGTADKRLPDPEGGGDIPWLLIRIRCM